MIRDITLGQYYPVDSMIHRLDPRTKILGTLIYIITVFVASNIWQYLLIGVATVLVIGLSKVPPGFMLKGLRPIFFILIFAFVINIFFTPGEVLFRVWKIQITREGLRMAVLMMIRLILLILGSSLLTLTSSPIRLTDGIERLFSPLKKIGFPAHELAMMMTIALRFIPTLLDETDKIMKAQMARGADFESGNILRRARSLIPLLVPLFIASFKRADELANAMESRAYRGGTGRSKLNPLKYQLGDLFAFVILMIFVILVIAVGRLG